MDRAKPLTCILLVDGDEMNSELTSFEFSARGYTVSVPSERQLVTQAVSAFMPDLAFIDISLQDERAFEIARHLQGASATCLPWLVALYADDDPTTRRKIADAGFNFSLSKHAVFADLLDIVEARDRELAANEAVLPQAR